MTRPRKPRRAGKRWLEGAPEYVLDCFDNKGKTMDRYTILFGGSQLNGTKDGREIWVDYLGCSEGGRGFSQYGQFSINEQARFRYASGKQRVRWLDIPEETRKHIIARATAD